jgi:DNA helicase-2/ATP-dependent DNA helicase PcrA
VGAPRHLSIGEDGRLIEDFVHYFYGDHLRRQFEEEDAAGRLEDLTELQSQIASYQTGLKGFLEEVALMTNLDAKNKATLPVDHILLSTIHQSKGMEWPVVILPWLVDTIFPSARSMDDGNIDEERRLFYVAVTRAKQQLILTCARERYKFKEYVRQIPSHFLRDVPDDLCERFMDGNDNFCQDVSEEDSIAADYAGSLSAPFAFDPDTFSFAPELPCTVTVFDENT